MSKKRAASGKRILLHNRKAAHDYHFEATYEAGIILTGDEVKALRQGQGSLAEAYAALQEKAVILTGVFIPPYQNAGNPKAHEARRPRTLLMHKHEIRKLNGAIRKQGLTLVPTQLYLSPKGRIKLELVLARGKTKIDKRETLKQRAWQRQKQRLFKTETSSV